MKLSDTWKFLPYILLVFYVGFVSYSFHTFNYRFNYVLDHTAQALQNAREVRTRLNEMQHTIPGLMTTADLSYTQILDILKFQEKQQDRSLESLKRVYRGNPAYLEKLDNDILVLREKRREAAQLLIGNTDYNKSVQLYEELIVPSADRVDYTLGKIIASSQVYLKSEREQASKDVILNIALTVLVGFLISLAFMIANIQDRRKTRELEDRERLFNQLSQNVDEIFIVAFNEKTFGYVTTNSERLIGIPAEKIWAEPKILYDFLPEEDGKWLQSALAATGKHTAGERTVITDNGNRVFRISITPVDDGTDRRAIIAILDKTADYQQQQALSDALETAHAASLAKGSFLAHMSHEIRTPMNAIIGMTTIALSKISDQERVLDCLGKISESSRHLLRLINDVLDMSKIETGKLSINQEPFSLVACIRNINDFIRPQAESRNLDFEIYQEKVDEEDLIGDPLRLNQILLNILSNALKFTPAGGEISLKIRQLSKIRDKVRLEFIISDSGIGMSQEFLNRLYLPFEQASSAIAGKYGGTGLGMSITFNLVTLMGGTINVDSKEGQGTTFHVELPFGYEEKEGKNNRVLPQLKILIVDDDHGTCEHAKLLLERMGLIVRWCTNGKEAIEMVKEAANAGVPYDICLIDWKMPEMDGAETSRRIREAVGNDMLIIIISAYDWTPIEQEARKAGVNDFIAKPFFASTLHDALLAITQKGNSLPKAHAEKDNRPYDFAGKRVLLVEDNEFNREIAQEFLDMVNIEVVNAEDGQEAVEKFQSSPPGYYDLILMDIQMPRLNGYEATRAIRDLEHPDARKIHIIAMTANAFSEDVANAVASGMNDHIAKPIDVKELYRKMRAHLDLREQEKLDNGADA